MKREKYWDSNGFHNTSAAILVEPRIGAEVDGSAIRRCGRKLCGLSGCTCSSSAASNPREGQPVGFLRHPELIVDWRMDREGREYGVVIAKQARI